MKVVPVETKVLIKKDNVEEKTASGLYMPPTARDNKQFQQEQATLIAKGSLAFSDWGENEQAMMIEGQRILINKYAGTAIEIEKKTFHMMQDTDIIAILED